MMNTPLERQLKVAGIPYRSVPHSPEIRVQCPSCHEGKYKLYINTEKRVGFCQRCRRGMPLGLLSVMLDLPDAIPLSEAIRDAAHGMSVQRDNVTETTPRAGLDWFPPGIPAWHSADAKGFLFRRGVSSNQMRSYLMQYCMSGPYEGRVVIPVFDREGSYSFFVARHVEESAEKPYLYPPRSPIGDHVFPEDHQIVGPDNKEFRGWVILVEGVFDAIHLDGMAYAIFGTSLSDAQFNQLSRLGVEGIFLMLDADIQDAKHPAHAAFQKLVLRIYDKFPVRVVQIGRAHV